MCVSYFRPLQSNQLRLFLHPFPACYTLTHRRMHVSPILFRPVLQCTWLGCLAGRVGCLPGPYNVTNMKAELRNEQKISTWCSSSELQSRKTTVTVSWLLVSLTLKCCPIVSLFRAKRTLCPTSAKHQEKGGVAELSVRYLGCFWNV